MVVVGLSGGLNWDHAEQFQERSNYLHDAAAVLVRDGEVVAALEEERDNRLKHSNKFPIGAVRYCLDAAGVAAGDVDHWAYCFGDALVPLATHAFLTNLSDAQPRLTTAEILAERLSTGLGVRISPQTVATVPHHSAHVASAFDPSGFTSALVVSYDGGGDDGHGLVVSVEDGATRVLSRLGDAQSLGLFYNNTMRPLGYGRFDEYKVMGLAPYGDPARYRSALSTLYTLEDGGRYTVHFDRFSTLVGHFAFRRPGDPFTQQHKDLAAAIQEALETMALHLIGAAREETGHRHLCLAGGVALNCTCNGKLVETGWFDEIFVQPVSTDAGAALGAALHVERQLQPHVSRTPLSHVYLGPSAADEPTPAWRGWERVLTAETSDDVCRTAAARLAAGDVLGWVQGRSEFGPRALGNRSIVADPRPAENKDRVNLMVKKREAYRPFAPSVLAERADEYFDLPDYPRRFAFMNFAVPVRPAHRALLQATTHVDGSSRVQLVFEDTNPRYWRLLSAFEAQTGVPVLLNTSFNNNAEPIVDSVDDALQCFLTTGLDGLVVGDVILTKRVPIGVSEWMVPSLPRTTQLIRQGPSRDAVEYSARKTVADSRAVSLSPVAFRLLSRSDGSATLAELLEGAPLDTTLATELFELWQYRLVRFDAAPRADDS